MRAAGGGPWWPRHSAGRVKVVVAAALSPPIKDVFGDSSLQLQPPRGKHQVSQPQPETRLGSRGGPGVGWCWRTRSGFIPNPCACRMEELRLAACAVLKTQQELGHGNFWALNSLENISSVPWVHLPIPRCRNSSPGFPAGTASVARGLFFSMSGLVGTGQIHPPKMVYLGENWFWLLLVASAGARWPLPLCAVQTRAC